jgi:branched-chain amino acid transport system ATP-binding protein
MNPQETQEAMDLIFKIRDMGLAVVVIEHDMRFIFQSVRPSALSRARRGPHLGHPRVKSSPIPGSSRPTSASPMVASSKKDEEDA